MVRPLLSTATLARLRQLDERAMPSSCRVLRRAATTSGGRTSYGDETVIAGPVACRLTPSTLRQPDEGERLGRFAETTHGSVSLPLDAMPAGETLRGKDRIEVTTEGSVETFEVVGDPWAGSYSTNLTVTVQRED